MNRIWCERNPTWCEREADVVRSLRTGTLSVELRDHVLSCVVCAETRGAAVVMLQTASLLRVEDGVAAAGLVWSHAQARKREIALKRATRPLIVMKILSGAYVILSATWFLHYLWRSGFMELLAGWSVLGNETTCFAVAIAVLAIVIAAGYLLHDSRRSAESVPST
jgi:hypothetical protein